MKRRVFLQSIPAIAAFAAVGAQAKETGPSMDRATGEVMTVRGRIRASRMGVTLTHEHLLANFNPTRERSSKWPR